MNGYIAFYRGKSHEVHAETALKARDIAVLHFKPRKVFDVEVVLAEKDGEQVVHTAAD